MNNQRIMRNAWQRTLYLELRVWLSTADNSSGRVLDWWTIEAFVWICKAFDWGTST